MIAALILAVALPRFVVMHLDVNAYGVAGTGTLVVDRATGRFHRRFEAGPASEQEGWDGSHAWRADATAMPRVQGNSGERGEIVAWSSAISRSIDASAHHVRTHGATEHLDITFNGYRRFGPLSLPGRIVSKSDQNGIWSAKVRSVVFPASVASTEFEPPHVRVHDAFLRHLTRLPVSMAIGSPVLDVSVNGRRLHFLLDTGGQNVLTTAAARVAGVRAYGRGVVSGGGGGTAPTAYGFADSVRVGSAEMRHQPFLILPAESLPPVDGIVGYELLMRFAARLDMARGTLELAPNAAAFGRSIAPAPFAFFDRQPQVDGSLDTTRGPFSIDTGSSLTATVQTPIVRSKNLIQRLGATVATYANDVGGRYPIYIVRARKIRLGSAVFGSPLVDLLTRSSTSNNSTIVANVGDGILRRWVLVFDYAHQTIDFRPGGDPAGNVVHDRSGIVLATKGSSLIVRQVLTGTPASQAGITEGVTITAVNGAAVAAADVTRVRNLFRGSPGAQITLQLADHSVHTLTLHRYL